MKKERFVDWWKQDKRYMTLLKAVLMALLPLLCCLVRTAGGGNRKLRFSPGIFRF